MGLRGPPGGTLVPLLLQPTAVGPREGWKESRIAAPTARPHSGGSLLSISVDEGAESIVVRASGELDLGAVPVLQDSLLRALERKDKSVILDLDAVSFIDLAGLRLLLWAAASSSGNGERVHVQYGSAAVHSLVELCDVDGLPLTR